MIGLYKLYEHLPGIGKERLYRGCAQMTAAAFFFSTMGLLLRLLDHNISEIQVIFLRNLAVLIVFLPALLRKTLRPALLVYKMNYGLRTAVTFISMFTLFASIRALPLPTVIALTFTVPLLTSALAAMFLGEKVGGRRWLAMCAGMLGALIIVRPGFQDFNPAISVMLFTACLWAVSGVLVKALSHQRSPEEITCGVILLMTPLCAIFIPFIEWHMLSIREYAIIAAVGLCGLQGQIHVAAAFSNADVSAVLPFDFLRLLFSGIFAYIFLDEVIDMPTMIGACIIAGAALYAARREAQLNKTTA